MTMHNIMKWIAASPLLLLCACQAGEERGGAAALDTIPALVSRVRACSRLYSAECKLRKIVAHADAKKIGGTLLGKEISVELPLGKRVVAIPIEATVKAYIDMSELSASDVRKNGEKVEIVLPDPKIAITATKVDRAAVNQYVPLLRSNFTDGELSAYEREGRAEIEKSIPFARMTEMARRSAARTIMPILTAMGFEEDGITITFRKDFNIGDLKSLIVGGVNG